MSGSASKPAEQVRQATVEVVEAIFIGSATDTRHGSGFSALRQPPPFTSSACGQTGGSRAAFDLNGRLRSPPASPTAPGCWRHRWDDTVFNCSSVLGREIARHPPAPGHTRVGGRCGSPNSLAGPFFVQSETECCDGVAMCAVTSRCQLKPLRDERLRRPLNPKIVVGGRTGLG